MAIKRVICADRVRQVPDQFSWVDHRLVRERYIERCDVCAAALYLFLVTVADAQGLSYYADASLARRLSIPPGRLHQARDDLVRAGLIAYDRPLYQVLALDSPGSEARRRTGVSEVPAKLRRLREVLGGRP
jgi:hypothetical protein